MESSSPPPPSEPRGARRRAWAAQIDSWKRTWYLLRQNILALVGIAIILGLVVMALYAATLPLPWNNLTNYCANSPLPGCVHFCTYTSGPPPGPNCYKVNSQFPAFVPPTLSLSGAGALPLGSIALLPSSQYVHNTWDGLLRGADWSLIISVSIVVAGAMIGLILGGIAGFFGGTVDEVLMRIVDIFLSIPQLLFVIVVVAVFTTFAVPGLPGIGSRVFLLIIAFIVVWWPFYTRLVRGQVLVTREQKYIEAARASGAGRGRLIFRHILPNSMYPVFIQMSLDVGTIPLLIGALSYLGFNLFGVSTGNSFPEWGSLSAFSLLQFNAVLSSCSVGTCVFPWWQIFFPGLMLFLFAISVNFFADGLRDSLDPRLRR